MSTTFAIKHKGADIKGYPQGYIPICHRSGIGNGKVRIKWYNEKYIKLPSKKPVYPLDNTAQGVNTIEDLIKLTDFSLLTDYKTVGNMRGRFEGEKTPFENAKIHTYLLLTKK